MIIRLAAVLTVLTIWAGLATCGVEAARAASAETSLSRREAECDIAERDTPTLDAKRLASARFQMVVEPIGWARDDAGRQYELTLRHGEEAATLHGGVKLRVSLGGCEDYSNQYVFSIPGAPPADADAAYWLRRVGGLIKEIEPASQDRVLPLRPLADALDRASRDQRAARDIGDGWDGQIRGRPEESYVVQVERRGRETVLTVSHYLDL